MFARGKMDLKLANSISYLGVNLLRILEGTETASPFQAPVGGTMKECYHARWLIETEYRDEARENCWLARKQFLREFARPDRPTTLG
jgi:hypothetical protein